MRILIVASFIPYPPESGARIRTWEIASRLLRDPTLYAHAVRSGSLEQAAMPRQ